jgi:hypothetical protein
MFQYGQNSEKTVITDLSAPEINRTAMMHMAKQK